MNRMDEFANRMIDLIRESSEAGYEFEVYGDPLSYGLGLWDNNEDSNEKYREIVP